MRLFSFRFISLLFAILYLIPVRAQVRLSTPNVQSILYVGANDQQPLVVGIGGSEGGNAWSGDYWKSTRDQFIAKGYAFLAIGYFGCENTPKLLDQISIDQVHDTILAAASHPKVNGKKIALIGGSRGADLALLLGSFYPDISAVVAMSASHAVFPGHTQHFNSSCWTFQGRELPFVPVNDAAVPFIMKRDLRGAFEAMIKDSASERKARIAVEKINGPVLLMSATRDEIIPAVWMGEQMVSRWQENHFPFTYRHLIFEGTHAEPTRHFDKIFAFLDEFFLQKK